MLKHVVPVILLVVLGLVSYYGASILLYEQARADSLGKQVVSLREQVEVLTTERSEAINQKDNALADLYKARQANPEAEAKQFYRGVYAMCALFHTAQTGPDGTLTDSQRNQIIKQCRAEAQAASNLNAHEKMWPGFDQPIAPGSGA